VLPILTFAVCHMSTVVARAYGWPPILFTGACVPPTASTLIGTVGNQALSAGQPAHASAAAVAAAAAAVSDAAGGAAAGTGAAVATSGLKQVRLGKFEALVELKRVWQRLIAYSGFRKEGQEANDGVGVWPKGWSEHQPSGGLAGG
jgi:hypothetical protein